MGSPVETTVKALVEFESELDKAKAEALESKQSMIKEAENLAESATSGAVAKAQQLASARLAKAKAEAEVEAKLISKNAATSLKSFEASVSKKKAKATEAVVSRLLGETN